MQTDYYPYILVREDILEDAYGEENVYTTAELQEIFDERGYFTEEELFDVEITSAEQFRTEFLPRIYNAIRAIRNIRSTPIPGWKLFLRDTAELRIHGT